MCMCEGGVSVCVCVSASLCLCVSVCVYTPIPEPGLCIFQPPSLLPLSIQPLQFPSSRWTEEGEANLQPLPDAGTGEGISI